MNLRMKTMPEMISNRVERLVSPPRYVPFATRCSVLTGMFGLFGAIFFSFGMIFVWVFGSQVHPIDSWRISHSRATAPAVIVDVVETNAYVNERMVYEYRFRYEPGDGSPLYTSCYSVERKWNKGDRAVARYVPGRPGLACIEGASVSVFPSLILLFILIFPAVGMTLFLVSLIPGWRKMKLLQNGEITGALSLSSSPTNTTINNVPVMKYTFEFRDRAGMVYEGSSKALPSENIGDEVSEPILYLPSDPTQSLLVDSIPLDVPLGVNESGQWFHKGGFRTMLKAILAFGLILIHVYIGIMFFF